MTISSVDVFDAEGKKSDKFTVSINKTIISAGTTTDFADIQPVTGLDVGTYEGKVVVTYGNGFTAKQDVSITVEPAKVSMKSESVRFVYDGKPHSASVLVTDTSNGRTLTSDNYTVTYTLDGINTIEYPTKGGEYTVTAQLTNKNYVLIKPLENVTLTIRKSNKKPIVIEDITKTDIDNIFSDILTHWAKESIRYVYEKDLFKGVTENSFGPDKTMTRGMVVTVLSRLSKDDMSKFTQSNFKDASIDEWFGKSVAWATENNITRGVSASEFVPNEDVSREQLVVMIKNYADYIGIDTKTDATLDVYTDNKNVSAWAKDSLAWAVSVGIINGKENNTLDPQGKATRAEVAAILMRFIENFIK